MQIGFLINVPKKRTAEGYQMIILSKPGVSLMAYSILPWINEFVFIAKLIMIRKSELDCIMDTVNLLFN